MWAVACAAQKFYYFPVEEVIKKMFKNPAWCEARGRGRDTTDDSNWYGASDAHRINQITGGQLFDPNNSAYELGFDYGQVFTFKTHSAGIMCIRWAAADLAVLVPSDVLPVTLCVVVTCQAGHTPT
jgi:hypothetical protein